MQIADDPGTRKRAGRAELLAVLDFRAARSELALADLEHVRVRSVLDVPEFEG
jgi:hypothetical protein